MAMDLHRRPLVVVEDHLYHIDRLLELVRAREPSLLERLTLVCLDRRGPDTQVAVDRWASTYPTVQVLADAEIHHPRHRSLPAAALTHATSYARTIAELLAPRGLLVQDIQLETLRFVPIDQWWETIYLANTVRGMFAERPPQCIFLSNKRGFHATFGKDLLSVGFDPRDVLHKDEVDEGLVPLLRRRLRDAFPFEVRIAGQAQPDWITHDGVEIELLSARLDVVLWEERAAKVALSGRMVESRGDRLELVLGGQEALSWRALVEARMRGDMGVSTRELGERVAVVDAPPAEQSNAAARHVYALRKRLRAPDALITIEHHYALADELSVGWVQPRPRDPQSTDPTGR
jgi:hypothetical protein